MRTLSIAVFMAGFVLAASAGWQIFADLRDNAAAESEYAQLRNLTETTTETAETAPETAAEQQMRELAERLAPLAEINPNFVGWLTIPGTTIDYPVVRGQDNARYLYTTFSGERNPAGAIFMDYRAVWGFAPVSIIYGHNMNNSSMFAPLTNFLDEAFPAVYSEIIVQTAEGEQLNFQITEVRRTNAWDEAYFADLGDPSAAAEFFGLAEGERMLILSTCLNHHQDARLLVFAVG